MLCIRMLVFIHSYGCMCLLINLYLSLCPLGGQNIGFSQAGHSWAPVVHMIRLAYENLFSLICCGLACKHWWSANIITAVDLKPTKAIWDMAWSSCSCVPWHCVVKPGAGRQVLIGWSSLGRLRSFSCHCSSITVDSRTPCYITL